MGLGSLFDPAGVFSGDKGDFVNNLLDPMGGFLQNNPNFDPFGANDFHNDVGEWMDDLGDTTELLGRSRTKNIWNEIRSGDMLKRDAATGFSGFGGSPIGTRFTNKINAEEDRPLWDMYGGATPDDYDYVASKGQDTSAHEGLGAVGSAVGKGFINAFTLGLGSTALDALNSYGYGEDVDAEKIGKNALKNYYINQVVNQGGNADYGSMIGAGEYSPIVNSAVKGGLGGGINAAAQGGNSSEIGQGFLTGAVQEGAKTTGGMGMDYLKNFLGNGQQDTSWVGGFSANPQAQSSLQITEPSPYDGQSTPNPDPQLTPVNTALNDFTGTPQAKAQPMAAQQPSTAYTAFLNAITGSGEGGGSLGSLADFGSSLYGLYNARKQRNALRDQQTNLQNMFGPNSPYAAQMRQRLERKDAAAGRRSQYGPREAQLAAMLADRQAQTMPHQMALQNAIGGYDNQMVNAGFRGLNQGRQLIPGLMNLFNGGQ